MDVSGRFSHVACIAQLSECRGGVCVCVCVRACMRACVRVQHEGGIPSAIMLQNRTLQEVECLLYLASQMQATGKEEKEMTSRIEKAGTVYQIWRRKVF